MTVFKFNIFYFITDDIPQERYVVAETEEEATAKLNAYFEKQHSEGFMKPALICDPTVELEYVI